MTDRLIYMLVALCLLASCNENDDAILLPGQHDTAWKAVVTAGETLDAERHYHTVGITTRGVAPGSVISLSTEAEWLVVKSDTLPSDGLFDVLPETNTDAEERVAELTLTNLSDGSVCVVELVQKGGVGYNDGATSGYQIGRGFSCFDEYKCMTSVRGNVINESKLRAFDSDSTFVSIQEVVRGEMFYEFNSAYSLSEMQNKLTQKTSSSTNILGFKKTVERYRHVSESAANEQYYGYSRMVRVVGSNSMDVGALKYIINNQDIINSGKLPFSDGFYDCYKKINKASGADRATLIRKMLDEYGTHVIVQASLGGSIDLAVTCSRNLVTSLEETTETIFKTLVGTQSTSDVMKSVNSSLSSSYAINICGGAADARMALEEDVKTLSATGTNFLSSQLLNEWLGSITQASLYDSEKRKNLETVDFSFIPIWELFADKNVSNEILSVVTFMADDEKNVFSDAELGIDNYALPLTPSLMNFGTGSDASLVRVASCNGVPVAEICNEFVPHIRSDRRITVVYPIANGISRITMGLFPGDGEYRPAYLSFADGDVYVNPIEGYGTADKLDTLYYLHGTLYAENQGIQLSQGKFTSKDHKLQFADSKQAYPAVKIGNGYWTRCDIKEYMDWGYTDMYGKFRYADKMVDGYEFARIYYTQAQEFMTLNQKVYDNQRHPVNGRDRWYVPRISDKNNLENYLGHNHKSMLQGQQSGFEAQFLGRCTDIDPNTGVELTQMQRVDNGTRCYVVFKNVDMTTTAETVTGASVLVLKPDYTWETIPDSEARFYYYPVRLFRTNYYNYSLYGI